MTAPPAFAFSCTKCGKCCDAGPALSIEEIFKYQDVFITGLHWTGYPISATKVVGNVMGETVAVQPFRDHLASFTGAPIPNGREEIYPHVYPLVTGYTFAKGRSCSALAPDGSCTLQDDKPVMCRSIPFDPALPEHMQGILMRRFTHDCMTKAQSPDAANVIFHNGRITDASCKADYQRRLAAMQKDSFTLGILSTLMRDEVVFAPTLGEFIGAINRRGWIETSMGGLVFILLTKGQISPPAAESYLHSQIRLINSEIQAAVEGGNYNDRERTIILRKYLPAYERILERGAAYYFKAA